MTDTATDRQWEKAGEVFAGRLASRQLVGETAQQDMASAGERPLSIGQIRSMIRGGQGETPFASATAPVPIAAIRLYRAFLEKEGLAFSRHARAASSDLVSRRVIGKYELDLVMEDDALFVMIRLDGNVPPRSMFLLHEDGRNHMLPLPGPVGDMIQEGLSRNDPDREGLVSLLLDPVTSITLI